MPEAFWNILSLCQLEEKKHTSITPLSLMITDQWDGSALLGVPSLVPVPGPAEPRLVSSLAGAALVPDSPYSISSSSSTVLLHKHE